MGHSRPLFIFVFLMQLVEHIMTRFEPQICGDRSDRSTYYATTTAQECIFKRCLATV